ncbi:MAG TPA: hypothetical protein VE084_02145 [Burkholderiaceae bacterium]|nr:hypothetical protein [Burkholderiaceae bacterium]
MNKLQAYIGALELAIRALDSTFVRANAAEVVRPRQSLTERWRMSPTERALAERAETASYDVTLDHWGSRLALMSAFEALHASLRVIASGSAHSNPGASAWREAAARAREAGRLAMEAAAVFEEASLQPRAQAHPPVEPIGTAQASEVPDELLSIR